MVGCLPGSCSRPDMITTAYRESGTGSLIFQRWDSSLFNKIKDIWTLTGLVPASKWLIINHRDTQREVLTRSGSFSEALRLDFKDSVPFIYLFIFKWNSSGCLTSKGKREELVSCLRWGPLVLSLLSWMGSSKSRKCPFTLGPECRPRPRPSGTEESH